MHQSVDHLAQEALSLSIEERAALAARLLESLDNSITAVSHAWLDVAEKRRDEVLSGNAQTADASQVSAHVRRHLQ